MFSNIPNKIYRCPKCHHQEVVKPVDGGIYCPFCVGKGEKVRME